MKRNLLYVGVAVAILICGQSSNAQVRINEFLADNVAFNPDMCDYDDFSDWIELYNSGSSSADIGGYYLTGDLKQPKKWQIPTGTSIPANGYLIIWADKNNAKPGTTGKRKWYNGGNFTTKYYHAAFKLGSGGEQVGLLKADGTVVDSVTFPKQYTDVSMGRTSDGAWAYFDEPTPGASNSTAAKQSTSFSGDVSFSVGSGYYSSAQTVTLTASDGSDIYYTTDGSIPYGSDKKYSGAITVSASSVIRARCIAADKLAGKVETNTYFINEKARKLMVLNLATDQKFLDDPTIGIFANYYKLREVPVIMEFFGTDGKPVAKANAGIQVGSLTNFDCAMKPLQVSLKKKYGDEFINYKFFETRPFTKFNRFRLRQGGDAFSSNYIADDLLDPISYGQLQSGVQAYRGVVVYINGKYYGIMDLREQFRDEYFKDNYGLDDATVKSKEEVRRLLNGNSEGWEVVSGSWNSYASLMSLVKSGNINYGNVLAQVDIDHMIDYISLETFVYNISWGHNEDFWKVPNAKWRWLTSDIDRCFIYSDVKGDIIHNKGSGLSNSFMAQDTLFAKLTGVPEFVNYFVQRYAAHLSSTFKPSRMTAIIDSVTSLLEPEMSDHAAKWGSQQGIKSVSAWQTETSNMKKFCNERGANILTSLAKFASGGTSALTIKLNPSNAQADIYINNVRMSQGLEGITLFKGVPFVVRAVGKPGWKCSGWEGGSGSSDSMSMTISGNKTVTVSFSAVGVIQPDKPLALPAGMWIVDRVLAGKGLISIQLDYATEKSAPVEVKIFTAAGKKVETLINDKLPAGSHQLRLKTKQYADGTYYYRLHIGKVNRTKMILVH